MRTKGTLLLLASEVGAFHHGLHWAPQNGAEDGVVERGHEHERIGGRASFTESVHGPDRNPKSLLKELNQVPVMVQRETG